MRPVGDGLPVLAGGASRWRSLLPPVEPAVRAVRAAGSMVLALSGSVACLALILMGAEAASALPVPVSLAIGRVGRGHDRWPACPG